MPGKIYPNEKEKLLEMLSPVELKIIQRDYPLKFERNKKIHELMLRGASCHVLAELSGLGSSSVHRIGRLGGNARDLSSNELNLRKDLVQIQSAVEAFNREIKRILHTGENDNEKTRRHAEKAYHNK